MNILVTGVSKGLGLNIAELLLKNNYTVYGISRTINNNLTTLISKYSNFIHLQFDLIDSENIRRDIFKNWIGDIPIHGLVNNAAIAYDDIITNINLEPLENMFKINVYSPMIITKYVIRQMLLHNINGSIVHISSISAHTGYKGLSMYAATKGAIESFSKNIAREWGERGIRSNCVVAGFMETDMTSLISENLKTRILKRNAMKTLVSVESVSESILFLISDNAKSITGQNIHVDNGTI